MTISKLSADIYPRFPPTEVLSIFPPNDVLTTSSCRRTSIFFPVDTLLRFPPTDMCKFLNFITILHFCPNNWSNIYPRSAFKIARRELDIYTNDNFHRHIFRGDIVKNLPIFWEYLEFVLIFGN